MANTSAATAQSCPAESPVVFVNVSLLTMDTPELLPGRTVLVRDGKVAEINPSSLPARVCRIDGAGRILMPGLSDVHVHTSEREMPLFLANGVTLARELNGTPRLVALRERIARGEVPGPRLLVTSPLLAGVPFPNVRYRLISSADDAVAAARDAKAAGHDYLKVYDGITSAAYEAFVDAGRTLGLKLDGHIPASVGLARVLRARGTRRSHA